MGYCVSRIGVGQVLALTGLLITLVSTLFLSRLILPIYPPFDLPVLLNWTGSLVFVVGSFITLSGALQGPNYDPFDLFVIGLVMIGGGIGLFAAAGFAHWNPAVNPMWAGPGPKPEAALISLYASIQIVVSLVATLWSLPRIFGETRRLARV